MCYLKTILLTILISALVEVTISAPLEVDSILFAICITAFLNSSISLSDLYNTMLHIVVPAAIIFGPIMLSKGAKSVFIAIFIVSFVDWLVLEYSHSLAVRLIIIKLTLVLFSVSIKKSAFTVPIVMPHTYELSPNQIRQDLWGIFSGFLIGTKFISFGKGQRTLISPAILERALKGIAVLVDKKAFQKLTSNPISIEVSVDWWITKIHSALSMWLVKQALTLIWPIFGIDILGRYHWESLSLLNHRVYLNFVGILKFIILLEAVD